MPEPILPRVAPSAKHPGKWLAISKDGVVLSDEGWGFRFFESEEEAWRALAEDRPRVTVEV